MAQRAKFKPNETSIENYQAGAVNWSMVRFKFDTPIGPDQKQYDPYYLYSIVAEIGGQTMDCAWFVNVDEHKIIQKAGATRDSLMGVTYVMEGKRRGLVAAHSGGPIAQRTEEDVEVETAAALFQLAGGKEAANLGADSGLGQFNGMLGPPSPVHPPPPPQGMPPQAPQPPQVPQPQQAPAPPPPQPPAPAPPPQAPTPPPQPLAPPPQAPAPPVTPGFQGATGMTGQSGPRATPAPSPSTALEPAPYVEQKVYTLLSEVEMDAWKAYWRDIAKLHIWSYHEFADVTKELDLPKIKPTDQREMVTSITIETWRQMGKGRSPLPGWVVVEPPPPPPDLSTKEGALAAIDALVPGEEENATYFIKRWLSCVVGPVESLENWKHAANIAKLFGLDAEVLFTEHDTTHMLMLTQAIWTYAGARDEGLERNESLIMVAKEYGLPKELMDFEEIVVDDEEDDETPF